MSEIYNIIDKQKLDIVSKPISEAHGLPNECYISKEYTLIERKKLFEDKWIVIGVGSSIPDEGDVKPIDLLGIPLLIVRTKNKEIKVFHNICSHRGVKLVKEAGKIRNVMRCSYHSWSYDLEGKLIATPHIGGMNIHQTPWKFAIENYCESYHLPWVHPGLNSYSKLEDHYHIQGLPNRFAGQGTVVYNPSFEGKEKFPCFPNWPKDKENIAEYVALFPNVMLGIHKDHYYAYWLEPINHEFTIEHMEIYYVGDEAANSTKYKSLRQKNHKQWEDIQKEDVDIIQSMQIGRNSPAYNGGNFSPKMDNPTHHFHKWVAGNLI